MQSKLWHYAIVPYLPLSHLLDLWTKMFLISQQLQEKEEGCDFAAQIEHVKRYKPTHFVRYIAIVKQEIENHKYRIYTQPYLQMLNNISLAETVSFSDYDPSALFAKWQNDIYLRECLYMLENDYVDDFITDKEWEKIIERFGTFVPLISPDDLQKIKNPADDETFNLAEL